MDGKYSNSWLDSGKPQQEHSTIIINNGQSNLAKGDIIGIVKLPAFDVKL